MDICFIMQPFDGGKFDKRYREIFEPAIKDANLEPYRVDQDPKVSVPIQDIERGIRESKVCLAEITTDNPNVWFELGFAFASGKEVVMVCSDERTTKFPFDVQHRTIIKYTSSSISDFEKLKEDITKKLVAYLEKAETLTNVSELTTRATFEGLAPYEVVALATVAENIDGPKDDVNSFIIRRDMEASGYTKFASTLALRGLLDKKFLFDREDQDQWGNITNNYGFTDIGWNWILDNKDRFVIRKFELPPEDDIPF